MRVATWNVQDYLRTHTSDDIRRCCKKIPEVIASLDVDLLFIQEIMCDETGYVRLASASGLTCESAGLPVALDPGRGGRGMGLMWNPRMLKPVADSLHTFTTAPALWQGMVAADFRLPSDVLITAACSHLTASGGPRYRFIEATTIARWLARKGANRLIGADWNCVSSATRPDGLKPYDEDPFEDLEWRPDFLNTCLWDDLGHWADRAPMEALERGGLIDVTAALNGPWQRTVGYWDAAAVNARYDMVWASQPVAQAATNSQVVETDITRSLSDHLPALYEFDQTRIGETQDAA